MTAADRLRALLAEHRAELAALPHPTRPGLSALDYGEAQLRYLDAGRSDRYLRKVVVRLRYLLGLPVKTGRPVSLVRSVHVRVSERLHAFVALEAHRAGMSMLGVVRDMLGPMEPVSGEDDQRGRAVLRVPLDVVEHHGSPAGVRRALLALMTSREVQ